MPAPSYIICATPRSGSTLLCDLLAATGVAGKPASFYRRQDIAHWAQDLDVDTSTLTGPSFERSYLDAVLRRGANQTGTFGLRLMWESAPELSARLAQLYPDAHDDAARFAAAFQPPVYVHLARRDKVAQAISRLKAEQSGLWHRAADGSERERSAPPQLPVYDFARLSSLVEELETHDTAWTDWFSRHAIKPVSIAYEALAENPGAVIAEILAALGRDPAIAQTIAPKTARLADSHSRDWIARFARDRAGQPPPET